MPELIEFDNFAEVETLLRAGMELKFELAEDSDVLNGSPVYASALNRLREGLISGLHSSLTPDRAEKEREWYRLSNHRHRWQIIARRAAMHPLWRDLTAVEVLSWVETIAAPLTVDYLALEAVERMVEAILDGE